MINIDAYIHDKFSAEFKVGFVVDNNKNRNDFTVNTWVFIPYSLDINTDTYPKNHFYRDIKSQIRLITPIYTLQEIASTNSLPYMLMQVAFKELVAEPSEENMIEFEYQIKMFISITKSAIRNEFPNLTNAGECEEQLKAIDLYVRRIEKITSLYRDLKQIIQHPNVPAKAITYFAFGDEFLSNRIDRKTFEVLEYFSVNHADRYNDLKKSLLELIRKEREHRIASGYEVMKDEIPNKNSELLHRLKLLRRYIDNHLSLNSNKKKDGKLAEQMALSIAAGLAMVFATAIAFSAQQTYGNFTMPLFVALVVSYILKDRIKELVRYYFASRLSKKYFDKKTIISIKKSPIGWIKEGVDFVQEVKVPHEVTRKRGRSAILESDNRNATEKIILYRKFARINGNAIDDNVQYDVAGINDIIRFNFSNFILRMGDSSVPFFTPSKDENYSIISGKSIYYINFIVQLKHDDFVDYKRFRFIISRDGIEKFEKDNF